MIDSVFGAVLLPLRDLRLGPMRLSPYGVCAAVGLVTGMALAGRAARRTRVTPEAVWDAGLFAVMSCFVASRLLLVLTDPKAFLRYPMLVLSLPSLTIGGMALAAIALWIHLRRRKLPVLAMMDTFAPAAAWLAAFLELGHWLDGSELGMPVFRSGRAVAFRPVSIYGIALALSLGLLLWRGLAWRLPDGRLAALGLVLGGAAAFGLDTITVPPELFSNLPLEPGQMVALAAMLSGAALWVFAPRTHRDRERETMERNPVPTAQEEVR